MPRIEILTIGDELIEGRLIDTNAGELSARLADVGLRVTAHATVGDTVDGVVQALRDASGRSDAVLVSGGLGPTGDDLTADAAAAAFGLAIERSAEALGHTRRFFSERGREMPATNEKQADLPAGCTILPNPEGTAVGFSLDAGRCRLYFMPGVPRELRRMADESVLPDLLRRMPTASPFVATLKVFGIGESEVAQRLEGIEVQVPPEARLVVQYRATFPEIHVRLVVDADERRAGAELLERLTEDAQGRLGRHVFAVGGSKLDIDFPGHAAAKLAAVGMTLAAAEIASAGTVAQLLSLATDGRRCFLGSVVAAKPEALADLLGPGGLTAEAAAGAVRERLGATVGVATFGAADDGDGRRPGALTVAVSGPVGNLTRELHFPVEADRFRRLAAYAALSLAIRLADDRS
jgi:nicotinamide-nucleotide amidase